MKLKIIFCEPPAKEMKADEEEQVVIIQSPYKIIQMNLGDTREYEKPDGSKMPEDFTYSQYCQEMRELIDNTLVESSITDHVYDQVTIEGFSQPPNFKAVCSKIEKTPVLCALNSKILFENCSFGGRLYTDSASKLVCSIQKRHSEHNHEKVTFEIILTDKDKVFLSKHDETRLALLKDVVVYQNNDRLVSVKTFRDDSLLGVKKSPPISRLKAATFRDDWLIGVTKPPLISKLEAPTFFYHKAINTKDGQTTAELVLKNFFSQEAQQQNDFTCGPATVKMVADYFDSMRNQNFCDAPITNQIIWHQINLTPEMLLAEQVNTSEAEGSGIPDIRNGLMGMGITVFDDKGLSNKDHNEDTLNTHKCLLWDKMHQILKIGIPIILNMRDREGCGHFEVVIGIDQSEKGEHIILAEPGTALVGSLEFENIPKDQFIARWKNMDGEFHGRFMILSPNEAATHAIDTIFAEVPHYKNGEERNRVLAESKPDF